MPSIRLPSLRRHLAWTLCLLGACTVGEAYDDGSSAGDDDGDVAGGADGGASSRADTPGCDAPVTSGLNSGNHNQGLTCIAAGCHDGNTTGAPAWTIAGTVFDGLGSNTPVRGATIHLIDGGGNDVKLISAQNGNFYSEDPFTFPLTAKGSRCPDLIPMVAQITEADGNCNKAGCHASGMRIYLPPP